ncbi:hypothetical protein EV668_1820 [Enterovirga rhinocerotis]|uniref:Uncharacterized protein n=2 Tax=Enterovirga rhinocerotis TaxID=1339210 RepID=A0A4R7C940_9HYPH|nr:hypothetical protein EV668_1820 [Enterovirga rhinocerotis]
MGLRAVLSTTLAGLVLAQPASAHWDYTRWGMSVEEVKAATKGKAADNADRDLDGNGFKTLLTAPHAWGRIGMRADFRFRDEDGRLNSVGLRPLEGGDCDAIRAELNKRHGKAQPDGRLIAKWRTKDGDEVSFSLIGTCRIEQIPPTYPNIP